MKQQKAKSSRPVPSSTRKNKAPSKRRASRDSTSALKATVAESPPSTARNDGERREAQTPASELRAVRGIDAAAAAEYQRLYAAAWTADAQGRVQLDAQRFAHALAEALVDPLTEQDVYSRALLAAAEGHRSLFKEDPILSELKAAS